MRYVYSSMLILSIIVNIVLAILISNKFKYKTYEKVSMIMIDTVGIMLGGLIYTKIVSNGVGFSSLGGVLGGLLFLFIYSLIIKKDYKYMLILFMPSIPLMYAIGKIGCFVAGCCFGIPYDGLLHVTYNNSIVAPHGVNLFPVQITETIVFLIIFIWIIRKYVKNNISIQLIMKEIMVCSIAKFMLDFLRYEHVSKMITSNQIMCVVLFIISLLYFIKLNRGVKKYEMSKL